MPSFQPFSSRGQSSHMQTPETTPLRKRENDSFASPEAPLLWRQPLQPATGALHNQNTYSPSLAASSSHFREMGFAHMSRRRGRHHDNRRGADYWVPFLMKAILASPLVVMLLWFIAVALHHPTESSTMKNNHYGIAAKKARNLKQQQQMQRAPHSSGKQHPAKDHKILPVYVPMGLSEQQQVQQQYLSSGVQNVGNPPMLIPQPPAQLMRANQQDVYGQSGLVQQQMMQQQPAQMMQAQPQMMQAQPQMMQAQPQMMQAQPQMMLQGENMMQLTHQQPGPLYDKLQELHQQQQQQQQPQSGFQQAFMLQQAQPNQMQLQQPYQQGMEKAVESQPILMSTRGKQNVKPKSSSNLRGGRGKGSTEPVQKVYYYDPQQAMVQGQLQAPSVVYDEHGNQVQLASLLSGNTDLYIEPPLMASPLYGASRNNRRLVTSSNSTATNSTSTGVILPFPPPPPPLEMKIKRPESWGESQTQDQSIIVVTVATMALLVGALSARRLRSRSFLSSCIENESLEDEVAFDSAYTVTGGDSYNTFGWKGDLEKFDV